MAAHVGWRHQVVLAVDHQAGVGHLLLDLRGGLPIAGEVAVPVAGRVKAAHRKGVQEDLQLRFGHHQLAARQVFLRQPDDGAARIGFVMAVQPVLGAVQVGEEAPGVLLKGGCRHSRLPVEVDDVEVAAQRLLPKSYWVFLAARHEGHGQVGGAPDPLWMQQQLLPDQQGPPVMADKHRLGDAQGIQQLVEVVGEFMAVVLLHRLRPAGMAIAALVGGDDMVASRHQGRYLVAPAVGMLRPAVRQEDGPAALAGLEDLQFHAVRQRNHFGLGKFHL